jgi:hypothetical protein
MPLDPAHPRFPIAGWSGEHPVLDLTQIPRERWPEAMRLVSGRGRYLAMSRLETVPLRTAASRVRDDVDAEERDRRRRARERMAFPPPLPGAQGGLPETRRSPAQPQVNFRLSRRQHELVKEAADLVGLKPGQLARVLTLRGVGQVLAEHDGGAAAAAPPER